MFLRHALGLLLIIGLSGFVIADPPTTQPADPTMDFLINSAAKPATQPVAAPATQAAPSTLVNHGQADDGRAAVITLNDGKTVTGQASTTADKPVRIWDATIKDYRDIPFALIKSATAIVNWERDEPEWQFKESGSDVKVFTGRTYPARETQYEFILINGDKITGDVAAPIYLETGDKTKTYVLHKRDKGELGQKLTDLVYVKKIEFRDENPDEPKANSEVPKQKSE